MFISKLSLPRRTFLRESVPPSPFRCSRRWCLPSRRRPRRRPPDACRFGAVYIPHGAIMDRYTPASRGRRLRVSADSQPLESVKEHRRGREQSSTAPATTIATQPPRRRG